MKNLITICFLILLSNSNVISQNVPNLPTPMSYASAEVWGDSIYIIGGSIDYLGTQLYRRIYKYDGVSWQYYDTIPFNHVWGIETSIKGDSIFALGGWSGGQGKLYMYRISTKSWTQLSNAPSVFPQYGHTTEYFNGFLYAFYNGYTAKYDPATNSWTSLATNSYSGSYLASTIYNGEFYLTGWSNSGFYKYNPSTNQWIELQGLPEFLSGGVLRNIGNNIYHIGGSTGFSNGTSWSIYAYNPVTNQWSLDSHIISSKRAYMEDVIYKNKLYVLGGMNDNFQSVNIVEYVMDQTTDVETANQIPALFSLEQNYPNPFNPSTKISWQSPVGSRQTLKVYDLLGNEVATLVDEYRDAGRYEIEFDASGLSSGVYFYKLTAGSFTQLKKMTLIK